VTGIEALGGWGSHLLVELIMVALLVFLWIYVSILLLYMGFEGLNTEPHPYTIANG